MRISIRNLIVRTPEAKKALKSFFEKNDLCPDCMGSGYAEKEDMYDEGVVDYPQLIQMKDLNIDESRVENMNELCRDIIYRELGFRSVCKKCDGSKFIEK